jgi:nucleoside-diphosphate-sugar epimerase
VKQPPFRKRLDQAFQKATVSVPDVDRAKLDYDAIRTAVGGSKGFTYGKSICTVEYSNSRQTQVYAATQAEAEKVALALAKLSTNSIRKVSTSTLKATGVYASGQPMDRDRVQIYPGTFYILSRKRVLKDENKVIDTKSGNYRERRKTIPLYLDKQPEGYNELINSLING